MDELRFVREREDGVTLVLKVKAGSKRDALSVAEAWLRVDVRAPAIEGKANAAVISLLAASLGVRRSAVTILRGEQDPNKVALVEGATLAEIHAALREVARR